MFGILKNGSLEINSLALINKLFQLQTRLPKWRQRFVQNGFKKRSFFVKRLKFRVVGTKSYAPNYTKF